jgi:hypothetical protein
MKRYRAPKAKPGQLKAQWGKWPGDAPELCYAWGSGVSKRDANLMHDMLCGKRARRAVGDERPQLGLPIIYAPSFLQELEVRGYDITTLKFSIQKKKEAP